MPGPIIGRRVVSAGVLLASSAGTDPKLVAELIDGRYLVWLALDRRTADAWAHELRARAHDEHSVRALSVIDRAGRAAICLEVDGDQLVSIAGE